MRFLKKKKKLEKTVLVISDIHLGAGIYVNEQRNPLEDFHSDEELVSFLNYFSSGDYANETVELIINGDFFDLLAVPFVPFFDDEFWSEESSLEKLNFIINAHPEVMNALNQFLTVKKKSLVYIIGNHDAELIFDSLKERFYECFNEENREKIQLNNSIETYLAAPGVYIQHGHQYEAAHNFEPDASILKDKRGKKYFIPSWGSYYVTHVINKYKTQRDHVNAVRPIKNFLIHGLIFDTFFILRFMMANAYYFIMVRFLTLFREKNSTRDIFNKASKELELFQNFDELTQNFFVQNKDAKVLIVGHTHEPMHKEYSGGYSFINTGTWTKMINLDLKHHQTEHILPFAKIEVTKSESGTQVSSTLNSWQPPLDLPFLEI